MLSRRLDSVETRTPTELPPIIVKGRYALAEWVEGALFKWSLVVGYIGCSVVSCLFVVLVKLLVLAIDVGCVSQHQALG